MPGKRITQLTALSGAGSANNDDVVIFDADANETKRISRSQLAEGMQSDVQVFSNKTIALANNTVNYNQGGTGAQTRTVQSRLQDFVSVKDFGAVGDGVTDDTVAINAALDAAGDHGEVYFPYADYIVDEIGRDKVSMTGRATLIAKAGAANVVLLGRETSVFWYRTVFGLAVDGGGFANGFTMEDIAGTTNTSAGRWLLENVRIENCVKGIEKLYGNISNRYSGISLTNCDFGYWAQGVTSPVAMHAGTDIFDQGHWHGCDLAAFYINDVAQNGGQHVWNECVIESNSGFGIFVKNHLAQNMPITVNNCWFENNGGGGSVTIDGVSYTPKDMYFANTSLVEINGCKFKTLELVNSSAQMDRCFYNTNTVITLDANSSLRITNALLDDYKPLSNVVIESVANAYRGSGGTAAVFATIPRIKVEASTFSGNVLFSDNGSTPVTFTGTSSVTTTSETDGLTYTTCQELVQPASHTALHPTVFAITSGKFYVTIAELKRAATNLQSIQFQDATVLCSGLQTAGRSGDWSTIASISKAGLTANVRLRVRNDDASPATLRYGALQVVEFDNYSDALSFFNSRLLVA